MGLGLSIYLLWQQWARPAWQPCNISATVNCDAIVSGPVSKTFGIPTPLFGFLGYIVILASVIHRQKKLLLGMATFGLLFCGWIGYREIFELKVICPVCIGCQLIMFSIFSLAVYWWRRD